MDKTTLLDRLGVTGEDRLLLAKVLDRAEQAQNRNIPAYTDFLSPQQQAMASDLLRQAGIDPETAVVAVVTNDFHCFRAHLIAQREGLTVLDVPAEVPWLLLNVNYYVREFFALGKTLIFD